ncbi:hypothetical protein [Acinetobacter baumannii]|uniref:hypothetical protein n=1 Tax=Acinetobacter baumannii TaxID=470 RepID=UPI003B43140F
MLKPRIFITIGLLLAGLTLFAVLEAYEKKTNVEKEQASRVAISFFNSLTIKIKTVHADLAGNPAGTYIVFVTVVKKDPKSNWLVTELGSGA